MPDRVPPIARIRLARSLPRLLAWPLLATGTGALAAGSWALGSFGAGIGGIAFAGLGVILIVAGVAAAAVVLSVRLEIEEWAVRLAWLGGERIYVLTPGPVTRVRLRGDSASRLRPRVGLFGWALGSARLRDEEEIQVVRLARTATAILVPTERGRLAIAAADEGELLDALSRAARARQRLEELASQARPVEEAGPPEPAFPAPDEATGPVTIEVQPPVLTGIERALLERRLAEERAAAAEAADAERLAALEAATAEPDPGVEAVAAAMVAAEAASESGLAEAAEPSRLRGRFALRRPRPSAAFVFLPLLGAGAAWGVGVVNGTYPAPGSDVGRLTSLALVLAGPATSVGAIMARVWWPRIVGVVVAGGLTASVFIGRALIGA
jgi:hypothetical protein